jgi:hypothetical protein
MDTTTLLNSASPLIGQLGAAFYFVPETMERGKELGLGGMEFYVLGRGGTMGNCDGAVTSAAFGYFNPAFLTKVWGDAKAKCDPHAAGTAHLECCANLGRAKLADVAGLDALAAALEKVNAAADPDGLALYAAISSEPLATDLPGRVMQLIAVLREHRGSAHLVALRAVGLSTKLAHAGKRPDMWKTFGYPEDELPTLSDADKRKLDEAEKITDAIVEPAYAVLTDAERTALVDGLKAVQAALAG